MKTAFVTPGKKSTVAALLFLLVFAALPSQASGQYPSLGIKMSWAGNGLANAPALVLNYAFDKTEFDVGANFQLNGSRFSGCQANIIRYVSPSTRKVRLGFYVGARYFFGASLSETTAAQEKWVQPESNLNFDELKMRCLETHAGFGIRMQHTYAISSFYAIGFGAYKTLGNATQYSGMHREVGQAELAINIGLSYSFR